MGHCDLCSVWPRHLLGPPSPRLLASQPSRDLSSGDHLLNHSPVPLPASRIDHLRLRPLARCPHPNLMCRPSATPAAPTHCAPDCGSGELAVRRVWGHATAVSVLDRGAPGSGESGHGVYRSAQHDLGCYTHAALYNKGDEAAWGAPQMIKTENGTTND